MNTRRLLMFLAWLLAAGLPRAAAAAQEREPQWLQAETRHFIFIFEPGDRQVVDELLTLCEPIYEKVCGFFNTFPQKVPCVIRGRVDEANGVTMSFPSKIELYCTAPTDHFLGARTESWLKALLTHELTHYVHQAMDRGLFHGLSRLFGSEVSTLGLIFLPGWMIEGPAVLNETRFTEGGRGGNPLFEMYPRALIEQGKFFSLSQAGYLSSFPPPGRTYVAGDLLVEHIYARYGEEAFRLIMDRYLAFPFFGPWEAIHHVTGRSADEIFEDLRSALIARYRRASSAPGGTLVSPNRVGDWTHPQATRAGLFVYRRSPCEPSAIVHLDPSTGEERVVRSGSLTDFFSFSASADGNTICFSSQKQDTRDHTAPVITADLFLVDTRTGATRQLTRNAHLWHPAVSADGGMIVAVQGVGPYTRLVSVDAATGELRVLFSRSEGNVFTPAFSPDGRRIAFTLNLRGFQDVCVAEMAVLASGSLPLADARAPVADVNAQAARPVLGPDAFGEYFPAFLDDTSLVFSSDRSGSLSLYRADLQSGECALLQTDPVAAIAGAPDGDSLLYVSYGANGWSVKKTALAAGTQEGAPEEVSAYPQPFPWTGQEVPARAYVDWPVPLAWLPTVTVSQDGPGTFDLSIGIGALAIGRSLLGRSTASVDAAWSTAVSQPLAGFALSTMAGNATLTASGRLDYRYVSYYAQTFTSGLAISVPLVSESMLGESRSFSVNAGLAWLSERDSFLPFSASDSLAAPGSDWRKKLSVRTGLTADWMRHGGQIDFNPPLGLAASLQNSTPLQLFDVTTPESDFALFVALTLPSILPHQAVKLGMKATYVMGGPFAAYSDEYAVPRGFAAAYTRTSPGGALLALDYLVPLALLDQPLLLGFALTGAGLALHAEALGQWGTAAGQTSLSSKLFVGGDLTLRLVYGLYTFPLGIGCAARIDTRSPGSFSPDSDLRIYLFLGFDSFAYHEKQGQDLRVRSAAP